MELILDASAVLAWFVQRTDTREAALADEILSNVERNEAVVPTIWYTEVLNGLLVAERSRLSDSSKSLRFLGELAALPITEDRVRPSSVQSEVLALGRRYGLTAYDAVYLELSLRAGQSTGNLRYAPCGRNTPGWRAGVRGCAVGPAQCLAMMSGPVQRGSAPAAAESMVKELFPSSIWKYVGLSGRELPLSSTQSESSSTW